MKHQPPPGIDYERLVQTALLDVVRRALALVARDGLPGAHHFYITFRTNHPGIVLSDSLKARYPEEMSIVLQHQFHNLEVTADSFSVGLSFSGVSQRITVPFAALIAFSDPPAQFSLGFDFAQRPQPTAQESTPPPTDLARPKGKARKPAADSSQGGKVVSFETFRKPK